MWKLKALIVSKADEDFDSSLDSENNENILTKLDENEENFHYEGKKLGRDKFNLNNENISNLISSQNTTKKVDWSVFYAKLFKNLGDEKKEKRISLKEIELRVDSVLNKYDVKKGVTKKNKKFDLSTTGKIPHKDNFISKIFDSINSKEKRFQNIKESNKHLSSKFIFHENSQLRASYRNMVKDFEINPNNLKNSKIGPVRLTSEENLNQNKIDDDNALERILLKRNNDKAGTLKMKRLNTIKKFLKGKESSESVLRNPYEQEYDKEEIFKNFKHDIRAYEKELAKLRVISNSNKKIKEVLDFISFDEIKDKINLSTLDKNFMTKSYLVEYKNAVNLIISNINKYNKKT